MIKYFMQKIGFPSEAIDYLCEQYEVLMQNEKVKEDFLSAYEIIFDINAPYTHMTIVNGVAEYTNMDKHTVELLFFLSAMPALKCVYKSRGISDEVFWENMKDFNYKLKECHDLHGVWGTMAGNWYKHFYSVKIYTHGRLQFEETKAPFDYKTVKEGSFALNCHIPGSGPLTEDAVKDAFKRVYENYKDRFEGGIVPIYCHSWLLYPPFLEKLKDGSNIKKFSQNFDIVKYHPDFNNGNFWRVFNKEYKDGITKQIPIDNSVKRALAELIENGDSMGLGNGVILLDGNF